MATKVNRQIVIVDDAVRTVNDQPDASQVELDPPTASPRGFRLGRRESDRERLVALHTSQALQQRVADLEAHLEAEKARAPRAALLGLDPVQLAELASETAVMILSTARNEAADLVADAQARRDAAVIDADKLIADAEQRGKNIFSEAKTKADKLDADTQAHVAELRERAETMVREATTQAEQLRAKTAADVAEQQRVTTEQLDAARAAAVAEVERLRETSEAEAAAIHAKAQVDAARIVKEAAGRRDGLISELEAQRRIVDAMIDDSAAVRTVLIEAYGKSRDTLELAIAKLNGPLDTAGRQAAAIAREIAALEE